MTQRPMGLVGITALSRILAARLASGGTRVLVHDSDLAHRDALASSHPLIEAAATLADIGIECDTIVTDLRGTEALLEAVLGSSERPGLAQDLAPGALIIDLTPGDPALPPRLQGMLGQRGIGLVDARPLPVDTAAAEAGTYHLAIGGYADFVDRAEATLSPLGRFSRTGTLGTARASAILAERAAAALLAALSETAAELEAGGRPQPVLAPDVIAAVVGAAVRSVSVRDQGPRYSHP